jgi:hypothetical protein
MRLVGAKALPAAHDLALQEYLTVSAQIRFAERPLRCMIR